MTGWLKLNKIMRRFLALCFAAVILFMGVNTYAWLEQVKQLEHTFTSSNFTAIPHVYFLQKDGSRVYAGRESNGYYIVNISDRDDPCFVDKLRVDIYYRGVTRSYLRVFISDMWYTNLNSAGEKTAETVFLKEETDMLFSVNDWLDNRWYDKYFYYIAGAGKWKGTVYETSIENSARRIPFIAGIENVAPIQGGTILLEVRVEAVQFNRIEAFWGMESIPQ